MQKIKQTFLLLLIAFSSLMVQAQIKSKIALGGMYSKGNVNKQDLKFDADFSRIDTLYSFSGYLKSAYSKNSEIVNNQELQASIILDYKQDKTISPFLALTAYNNKFKDLNLRFTSMIGSKWTIYKKTDPKDFKKVYSSYSLSFAFQYDIEKFYSDKPDNELSRLSIRPKFRQMIVDNVFLDHITFFKYKTNDFDDYQIDSRTDLSTQITKKLLFQLTYEYDFSSKPPQPVNREILKEDQIFYISLVYKIY